MKDLNYLREKAYFCTSTFLDCIEKLDDASEKWNDACRELLYSSLIDGTVSESDYRSHREYVEAILHSKTSTVICT